MGPSVYYIYLQSIKYKLRTITWKYKNGYVDGDLVIRAQYDWDLY